MITTKQWKEVLVNGGATLDVVVHDDKVQYVRNMYYKTGYAVSIKGHELRVQGKITKELFKAYVNMHKTLLQASPEAHVGLWNNGGYWYLDISLVFNNIYNAVDAANFHNQLAIYSFSTGESLNRYNLEVIK
jgi:hypothetical protein